MDKAWFSLKMDERGNVLMVLGDDRVQLGPQDVVCQEFRRFMETVDSAAREQIDQGTAAPGGRATFSQ